MLRVKFTPSPAETVIIALPAAIALTLPSSSTVTTDSLLEPNEALPAPGVTVAVIVAVSPTSKFNSVGFTTKLVSFLLTVTVTVTGPAAL